MKFADIPGHDDVKQRLRQMVDDHRIPHALLLEGPAGTAKFALARAMAQYIHCTNHVNGDSCGKCAACLQHQTFNHADTFYSFPVIKKNSKPTISDDYAADFHEYLEKNPWMDFDNWLSILGNANAQPMIYVEEAAELLRKLNLTARSAKFKVVVMWLPERLREEAANKLLKLVEEPFPDTIFLMTSDNPRKILPTIYSRTQRISVKRYDDAEVAAVLSSTLKIDSPTASALASTAEGSLSRALALAGSDKESQQFLDLFMELMRLAWQRKVGLLKAWSVKVAELGREGSMRFYDYCARMVRENFIMNLGVPQLNLLTPAEKSFSVKFSPFINERNVEGLIEVLDAALRDTMLNGNAKIISFDLAVKAILLIKK